jgi:DNA-binding NtrC family response regulator
MKKSVLLIEGEMSCKGQCAAALRDLGWEVSTTNSSSGALTLLGARKFDAALVDLRLAGVTEGNLLTALERQQAGLNVVLMVDVGAPDAPAALDQPMRLGGYPFLTKPLNIRELERVLDTPATPGTRPTGPPAFPEPILPVLEGLIGTSEKMRKVCLLISKVAQQRHPVLIVGESGTGKELVARAIHRQGPWQEQPFVPVDCGALPPTLIESELFGHVKGAFTGATQSRQGLLAAAGTGTVFLDEVGELPTELQSRLLRALQEREIKPLGSNQRQRIDARIIAATNQDLSGAMQRGAFRKDLFFRLNVVSIKLPSLRDRKEDIPALVQHFIALFGNKGSKVQISDEAMGRLISYAWPGNVRELENCIQRAVSLGSGAFIQMQDLPSSLLYQPGRAPSSRQELSTLQALEQQAIRQALLATAGDRTRAAKLLGIGKTTIYRKLKEYGMEHLVASLPHT